MRLLIYLNVLFVGGCATLGISRSKESLDAQEKAKVIHHKVIVYETCLHHYEDKKICSCVLKEVVEDIGRYNEFKKCFADKGLSAAGRYIVKNTKCGPNIVPGIDAPITYTKFIEIHEKAEKAYFYNFEIELSKSYPKGFDKFVLEITERYAKTLISPTYFPQLRKLTYEKKFGELKKLKTKAMREAREKMESDYGF